MPMCCSPAAGRRQARRSQAQPDATTSIVANLAETLSIAANGYLFGEQARVVGCVISGLPGDPSPAPELGEALAQHGLRLIAAVQHRPELAWLRVRDLVRS